LVLSLLGALAGAAHFGLEAQAAGPSLRPGETLERRLAGGEAHSYCIEAAPGARLLVSVDQQGIDVEVALVRPDGTTWIAVDGPTESEGLETLLLPADAAGPLEIRVGAPGSGAAPGAYTLRLTELAETTSTERGCVEAERLMTEAAARNREGTGESLRLAAARYEEARALWHSLADRAGEARCALAAGSLQTSLGEPKAALESYRQALDRFVELGDAAGQATAWSDVGAAQIALGDLSAAAGSERRALSLERGLGRPLEEGKVLNYLGLALHFQGELSEVLQFYEAALAVFAQAGEQGAWKVKLLHNLAALQMSLGEAEAALASHRQVLALERALGDRQGEAQTLNSLGVLDNNLGEFGDAIAAYTPALASFRRSGDRRWEAVVLHNLGVAYHGLGDYRRALAELEQALTIRRDVGDRRGEIATQVSLGHAELALGETARALDTGRQAARLASESSDRGGELLARLLLGEIGAGGGQPEAALSELAKARDLARELEDRLDEATILQLTGQAYLVLKQPDKAAQVLREAVELARVVKTPARIVGTLVRLSRAEWLLGRPAEARATLEEALGLIEAVRATETEPNLRASFLASEHGAFELEVELLMELDRREPGEGHAREALEASERARARSLLDLLQEASADVHAGVDPGLRARERALLLRLNGKAGREDGLLRHPAPEERRRAAEAETRSALEDLTQVEAEIRRQSPRYAGLTQPPLATSGQIQSLLDRRTVLLEYSLGEERSFLWAVDRDSVTGFELPPRARIEAVARELYGQLSTLSPAEERRETAASTLSRMVLGPVAGRLAGKRVIVAADGELQYIPFGVLPDPQASAAKAPAPLLAGHEVVNVPSASAVILERRLLRRAPVPNIVAVLADPVFAPEDPRVGRRAGGKKLVAGGPALRSQAGTGELLRLPWTRREAEAIRAVAPAGQALLALDFRASRETALSPELSRYRIVHFATHGIIDSRTPALSGLMLSRVGEQGTPVEGFLGLSDVYNLRLGADLVVLSGCETALGEEVRGEGLVGLTQGFLYAGAKLVVASLWRVEDRATAELMSSFYRGLLVERLPAPVALRRAQLAVRRLQLSSGTAARLVSGIAVATAGAIALTVMPSLDTSSASERVNPSNPCLLAA